MKDEDRAIIERAITIQRMVKEGASSEDLHAQVRSLDKDVSSQHAARYTTPVPEVERKRLIEALENGTAYTLRDKAERVIFATYLHKDPQHCYPIALWRRGWCNTTIGKASVLDCFDKLMRHEYPAYPVYPDSKFEPWE